MVIYNLIKGKAKDLNNLMAIEVLYQFAAHPRTTLRFRQEIIKHDEIKRLADRVKGLLKAQSIQTFETLGKATFGLARMGFVDRDSPQTDKSSFDAACIWAQRIPDSGYMNLPSNSIGRFMWAISRAGMEKDPAKKTMLARMVREVCTADRVRQLEIPVLIQLLTAVARFRTYKGERLETIHVEASDEELFKNVAIRVIANLDSTLLDGKAYVNLSHAFAEIGIRNEELFNAICPKILEKQEELRADDMAKVVKAFARFAIPLREKAQGFRHVAVVSKGDFVRPSEKPKGRKKFTYEKPDVDWT